MFSSLFKFHLPHTSTSLVFIDLFKNLFSNEFDEGVFSSSPKIIMFVAHIKGHVFDDDPSSNTSVKLLIEPSSPLALPSSGRPQRVTKPYGFL